jgi:cell division protein FtsW
MVNLAVAMAILPTKGLTLPFVSYGGSSLLVNAMAAGILLNISRQRGAARLPIVSEKIDAPEASAVVVTSAGEGAA